MKYRIEDIEVSQDFRIKLLNYEIGQDSILELDILSAEELEKFKNYKSAKRQLEFYYTRLLWQAFNRSETISYRATGKPMVEKGFLSISHSNQSIAIIYSAEKELGIDIEPISKKIERVKHKFTHADESFETLEDLTKAWCVKEAVYKLMDMDDVFFMDHIYLNTVESGRKAKIMVDGIDIQPTFNVKKLDNDLMMAWAYII
ncbi:MAG: 4'-phosphopantetheinyl transferase superfamily protein [Crocinitomicaceae bacterium]